MQETAVNKASAPAAWKGRAGELLKVVAAEAQHHPELLPLLTAHVNFVRKRGGMVVNTSLQKGGIGVVWENHPPGAEISPPAASGVSTPAPQPEDEPRGNLKRVLNRFWNQLWNKKL